MTDISDPAHRFPCQTCGSDLRYAPGTNKLSCDHCGNSEPIAHHRPWRGKALKELDFRRAVKAGLTDFELAEIQAFECSNCGANVEFDAQTHSAECPFCATPVVGDTGAQRQIKPQAVLPFELSEEDARKRMSDWLGSLWFAPNGLQQFARKGRKMQGIYVPYWTYDADTRSQYSGQRGTVYYVNQSYYANVDGRRVRRTRRVAKTRWRPARGRVARFFDDVLVLASTSLPKDYTDELAPWDLSELRPYDPSYLAGFRAEGYTVRLEDGYQEATAYINRMIERDIRFDIGGDKQRITSVNTEIGTLTFKHILLPVWLAAYKYRGKTYRFVVNARTGAVKGERPYARWKIVLAALLCIFGAMAIGILLSESGALQMQIQGYR